MSRTSASGLTDSSGSGNEGESVKGSFTIVRERPLSFLVLATVLVSLICVAVVGVSVAGWPSGLFSFDRPRPERLADNTAIQLWGHTSRDSYMVGEPVDYQMRIQYRPEQVTPDLDLVRRSADFYPFETLEVRSSETALADGVNEFVLDFVLQGVDVLPGTTYALEPIEVFYSENTRAEEQEGGARRERQMMRYVRPPIHIASYYPSDVADVPLRPAKGSIAEQSGLRRGVMTTGALAILGFSAFYLWRRTRRRAVVELSEPERLWQELHDLKQEQLSSRDFLLRCEKIFTRLLQLRARIDPRSFWAGAAPSEPSGWAKATAVGRRILSKIYRRNEPSRQDMGRMVKVLDGMLSPLVDEERMKRENEPSAWIRLRQQPHLLGASGAAVALAAVMLVLAAVPRFWVSPDILRYNEAVRSAAAQEESREQVLSFTQIVDRIETEPVKAAALYNAGTTRAGLGFATGDFSPAELLNAVFQDEEPIISFLDSQESIDTLLQAEIALGEAERELKDAVRTDRDDEDIRKNLELVGKRYRAVSKAVEDLFAQASALPSAQGEAIVDVLQMKMPEKFKEPDKGKDNSNYLVLEKF